MLRLILSFAFLLLSLPATSVADDDAADGASYVAIAFSFRTGLHGAANRKASAAEAEAEAPRNCRVADCHVLVTAKDECAALCVGVHPHRDRHGAATAKDSDTAIRASYRECRLHARECSLVNALCAR